MVQEPELIKFEKPIIFSCTINGKPLTASVLGKYELPIQYACHVSFTDGFSALFVTTDNGWWVERKGGKANVDAISEQLTNLIGPVL